jgi:cobalt-zinc-cadmium efflux system protein
MAHHHGHGHGHRHRHGGHDLSAHGRDQARRLAVVLVLVVGYLVVELVGAWVANSLALLADATHLLSDVGALGLSLFAIWIARRPPSARRSYGYYRVEILAALINGAALIALALFILMEAVGRLRAPEEVAGGVLVLVAAGGLVVNLAGLGLLRRGKDESLNIRGAWLHLVADLLGTLQVMVAGALIWAFGWTWVDPLASVLISLLVAWSAWALLREAVSVLMESTPGHLDADQIHAAMAELPGVVEIHDLHIWTITSGFVALSAHVVTAEAPDPCLLADLRGLLQERFGVGHTTLQLEPEGFEEAMRSCRR